MVKPVDTSVLENRVPPVVWALTGALSQRLFPTRRPPRWVRAASLVVLLASAALGVWAIQGFKDKSTTLDPHQIHTATALVTHGAHSVSRNPMYTALLGSLVGLAMWRGRVGALVPVVAVWAALSQFQIAPEEAALTEAFGSEFERYREAVPRWL